MKALSLWQPWAWLVAHGVKDVENRAWRTHHRGWLFIHASRRVLTKREEVMTADSIAIALELGDGNFDSASLPGKYELGGLVGMVQLIGCIRDSVSSWSEDDSWHWVLRNARAIPFVPMRGARGLFDVDVASLPPSVQGFLPGGTL